MVPAPFNLTRDEFCAAMFAALNDAQAELARVLQRDDDNKGE